MRDTLLLHLKNEKKNILSSLFCMKQPQLLTLQDLYDELIKSNNVPEKYFFEKGFGVIINLHHFLQPFIHSSPTPYLIEDYRMGYVKQGQMHGIINLQEYTITAGHIVFITPGTIVEPLEVSTDFQLMGMGVPSDLFHLAHSGKLPDLFTGKQKNGILPVTAVEGTLLDHLFCMLCEVGKTLEFINKTKAHTQENDDNDVIYHLIATITSYYNKLFAQFTPPLKNNASKDIFDCFIRLVNKHCEQQRQLAFYANELCITERYLCTIIRQTSGITAKEWIDKAVITAAKVKLRHGNEPINIIADQLSFSNPSFFSKYFKRLVGCTPQVYRDGKQ